METINNLLPIIYLALGLSFIGMFTKYKIFLILSVGFILFLAYEFASVEAELSNGATGIILTSFAGWILFNVYLAFRGDDYE